MAICPSDMKPCCDDLCYGSGCLRMAGVRPLVRCDGCGAMVTLDGEDIFDECECNENNGVGSLYDLYNPWGGDSE